MRKIIFLLSFLLLASSLFAQPTKSTAAVDEWAEVGQDTTREGATVDVSGCYSATLLIGVALSTETAHTGSKIDIQLSGNSSGDEDWRTFVSFIGPTGTANSEATSGTENAGAVTIECASTTGTYDDDEAHWIFFEHTTPANSELAYVISHEANASVGLQDGITNDQTAGVMFDIADVYVIKLPTTANRVRIIYDNTYDADGSTIHTSARITKVTGL